MSFKGEFKDTFKEGCKTSFTLFKIMIPISIIVKILAYFGLIETIGKALSPVMGIIGLPGEFGLVWATTLVTNIYGGLIVFFNLSLTNTYTVAQVTILSALMLLAHTLPIEARIAQKAGVRLWFTLTFRILCAIILAGIFNLFFSHFNILKSENSIIWQPTNPKPTIYEWIFSEMRNYVMIFLIILGLVMLMRLLKNTGILEKMNNFFEPILRIFGMSKNAAPITIIGTTLGLAYGGGLIIKEAKSKVLSKKDVFLSVSLMNLSHSLIEDTLIMLSIGASILGVLFGRIIFSIIVMIILINIVNKLSNKVFKKYLVNY